MDLSFTHTRLPIALVDELIIAFGIMCAVTIGLIAYVWRTILLAFRAHAATEGMVERFLLLFKNAGYVGIFHASAGILIAGSAQTIVFAFTAFILVVIGVLYLHVATVAYDQVQRLRKVQSEPEA